MLRLLGGIFVMLGILIVASDVLSALSGPAFRLSALGEWWAWVDRDSLLLFQPAVERHISPVLWEYVFQPLLEWPAAIEFGVLGAVLRWFAR